LGSTFMMLRLFSAALLLAAAATPAQADKIKNPTAVVSGLDKNTGRIIAFEVAVDETVQFGALQLTPRVCYSRPATENPNTTGFIEVDEVTLENKYRRIFTGWMFAASPGLHGIEHPVYDIWLTDCKGGTEVIAEPKEAAEDPAMAARPPVDRNRRREAEGLRRDPGIARAPDGRIDVAPQRGVPVQPRQQPSRRFYPQDPQSGLDALR
jgi:hypothetical protein